MFNKLNHIKRISTWNGMLFNIILLITSCKICRSRIVKCIIDYFICSSQIFTQNNLHAKWKVNDAKATSTGCQNQFFVEE